jgi:hypothetical protein
MPSSHPIPSFAALSLSFLISMKHVDRLPKETTVFPWETCEIVKVPASLASTLPCVAGLAFEVL